jgi:hypothetical protein
MIIRALLPKLAPKTVKEKIIIILSTEFPLTIKELKQKIKNNFNDSVSYQSVHKELSHLMSDEIIKYDNKKYLLNIEWIKQVGLFSDLIVSNYTSQKKHSINKLLELKNDGDSLSFDFESYAQLDNYFMELIDYFNEFFEKDKKILMHYTHNWWPLVYPLREKQVVSKLKSNIYCICGADSPIDKFCCCFENKIGINVLFVKNQNINWNVNIMGDLVFSMYGDNSINEQLHQFFEKNKDLKNFELDKLVSLLQKKGGFRVLVVKDSTFAQSVLQEIKLFKKEN